MADASARAARTAAYLASARCVSTICECRVLRSRPVVTNTPPPNGRRRCALCGLGMCKTCKKRADGNWRCGCSKPLTKPPLTQPAAKRSRKTARAPAAVRAPLRPDAEQVARAKRQLAQSRNNKDEQKFPSLSELQELERRAAAGDMPADMLSQQQDGQSPLVVRILLGVIKNPPAQQYLRDHLPGQVKLQVLHLHSNTTSTASAPGERAGYYYYYTCCSGSPRTDSARAAGRAAQHLHANNQGAGGRGQAASRARNARQDGLARALVLSWYVAEKGMPASPASNNCI